MRLFLWSTVVFAGALSCLVAGCRATTHAGGSKFHDRAHEARPPYAEIAVNLGLEYEDDLLRLYDSLAYMGVRCGIRAMSLGAEQVVVEVDSFDRAKAIVEGVIIRDRLTVRVYKTPSSDHPRLDVWERGQKVREEEYKLYLPPYTGSEPGATPK